MTSQASLSLSLSLSTTTTTHKSHWRTIWSASAHPIIKTLRPKMTKIASMGSCLNSLAIFIPKMGQSWHANVFFNITLFWKKIVAKQGRNVIRNHDVFLQIDKGEAISKKARLLWQKKINLGIVFIPAHLGFFAVVLSASHQCSCYAKSSATGLCAADRTGTSTTHTCSERLLVGEKAKPLIFVRKRESCFTKVEHTWNWKVKCTSGISFLEWTIAADLTFCLWRCLFPCFEQTWEVYWENCDEGSLNELYLSLKTSDKDENMEGWERFALSGAKLLSTFHILNSKDLSKKSHRGTSAFQVLVMICWRSCKGKKLKRSLFRNFSVDDDLHGSHHHQQHVLNLKLSEKLEIWQKKSLRLDSAGVGWFWTGVAAVDVREIC